MEQPTMMQTFHSAVEAQRHDLHVRVVVGCRDADGADTNGPVQPGWMRWNSLGLAQRRWLLPALMPSTAQCAPELGHIISI